MGRSASRWCLCSKVALSTWRLCCSRGLVLLSLVVTIWNYVEISSGVDFTRLYWRLSLSLSFPWDPLEITIQCHFPARAAQRPVGGALVMENYQLAPMKWPLERPLQTDRPLPLSLTLDFTLPPSQFYSLPRSFWNWVWNASLLQRTFVPSACFVLWSAR